MGQNEIGGNKKGNDFDKIKKIRTKKGIDFKKRT